MNDSVEVNTDAFSYREVDGSGLLTLGDRALDIATNFEVKEQFFECLDRVEQSQALSGIVMLNTHEYQGDDRYLEFLNTIMGTDSETRHLSGMLSGRYGNSISQITIRLAEMTKPVIMGMSGAITSEQLGISLPCDYRIVTADVAFTFRSLAMGYPPNGALVFYLLHTIGPAKTTELLYASESLSAERALEFGLVSRIVPEAELEAACLAQMAALAKLPAEALAATRKMLQPDIVELARFLERSRESSWSALVAMKSVG